LSSKCPLLISKHPHACQQSLKARYIIVFICFPIATEETKLRNKPGHFTVWSYRLDFRVQILQRHDEHAFLHPKIKGRWSPEHAFYNTYYSQFLGAQLRVVWMEIVVLFMGFILFKILLNCSLKAYTMCRHSCNVSSCYQNVP